MKICPADHKFVTGLRCALFVILPIVMGCSNPVAHIPLITPEQLIANPTKQIPYEQTYRMVPYDLISVRFTYHPEQDPKAPVAVRPDGQISLDGVGTLQAAGRTPEDLAKDIAAKSSKRLRDPDVVVTVAQYAPRKIYVGGQVKQPGIVQFQGEITPVQAIFERGGFTSEAQMDSVILIRNAGGPEPIIGRLNVDQSLENGTPEKITLLSNDVLYVPLSGIGRADLWVKQHLNDIMPTGLFSAGGFAAGIR